MHHIIAKIRYFDFAEMIRHYLAEFNLLRISIAQNNKLVTLRIEDVVGASRAVNRGKNYVFRCSCLHLDDIRRYMHMN